MASIKDKLELADYVALVVNVPTTHADKVREALGQAGAGRMGNYSSCTFLVKGTGRFKPEEGANPFIGSKGVLEEVEEEQIQTICSYDKLEEVMEALKKAHPYEEPSIELSHIYLLPPKK